MPDIPGTKKKLNKKTIVIGAIGLTVGVVAIVIYRRKAAGAAANSTNQTSDTSNAVDPNTGIPYAEELGSGGDSGIDPSTGVPYADELGGYGGVGGYSGFGGGYGYPMPQSNTSTSTTSSGSWADQALTKMEQIGYNGRDVALALGKYLSNQPLTAQQKQIIQEALAFVPGGPLNKIHSYPHKGQNKDKSHTVAVPDVIGKRWPVAVTALTVKGLKPKQGNPQVKQLVIAREEPAAGTRVKRGTEVKLFGPATK